MLYRELMPAMLGSWEIGAVPLAPAFVASYKEAGSRPGALSAMLNHYRATQLHPPGPGGPGVDICHFPEDTHWIAHEFPDQVNRLIREFIGDVGSH